jgi:glutathione S-transferase
MKLYASTGACGLHVQIIARETGVPFDLVLVDLSTKRTADGRDFNTVTPKSYIPVWEFDDGRVLTEGAVITQWLADQAPEKGLLPSYNSFAHYQVLEWLHYIGTEIHKSFGPLFKPAADAEKAAARDSIIKRLGHVEAQLGRTPYLVGDHFGIADAYLFNVLTWAKPAGVDLSAFPKIRTYQARIAERPAVRDAMIAEGLIRRKQAA